MHAKHTALDVLSKKGNEISTNNMQCTPNRKTLQPYLI